jgi:hypothetical protein
MTSATPDTPQNDGTKTVGAVKIPEQYLIKIKEEDLPIDVMAGMIFENIGGQELISLTRNDIVNGQDISYQPIKNLSALYFQYNPNNLLKLNNTSDARFKKYAIKFSDYVPDIGTGPDGEIVYIEEGTGDLIINVLNLPKGYEVEVEILDDGTILDDTIY